MKSSTCINYFFIFLHISYFLLTESSANIVSQTCQHTPNPNLCISTLNSDPKSSTAADVSGLTIIGANILSRNAASTKDKISSLLKNTPSTDRQLVKSLKCSEELYNLIVTADIPEIIEAVTKGDPKFGQDGADDVSLEADTCQKCFLNSSPIHQRNMFVHDFSVVLSSMIQMLL
ncbi:cell wall / vacuolar inhibitor of fructosidase 1-like [Rutidosis leptorrhynchoides]|uniref:cell wall / vacuolar inhibitor of fructosidase 1-like n=1 Tax=Rutidosis leptorrhynchoides TaxID=125765 RepID=UPI003A98D5F5